MVQTPYRQFVGTTTVLVVPGSRKWNAGGSGGGASARLPPELAQPGSNGSSEIEVAAINGAAVLFK